MVVEIYTQIHATPPANLNDLARTLSKYADVLGAIRERQAIPPGSVDVVQDLNRFLQTMVQKAIDERYRSVTQGTP